MYVQCRGGASWVLLGGSLEFHPPSWSYRCNERVRNSNAVVKGHWYALGDVPYAVASSATHSMALYQEGDGKRKEGVALLGDG